MSEVEKKRLFIALNLPKEVKEEAEKIIKKLAGQTKAVKWVKSEGLHLTLHFLGYLDDRQTEQIKLVMQSFTGKFGQFNFILDNLQAFPDLQRPRVIFLKCRQTNGKTVFKLQQLLGQKLRQLGFNIDQRIWQPHLTLGRIKEKGNWRITPLVTAKTAFVINTFELMQSTLKPDGAYYQLVTSLKL